MGLKESGEEFNRLIKTVVETFNLLQTQYNMLQPQRDKYKDDLEQLGTTITKLAEYKNNLGKLQRQTKDAEESLEDFQEKVQFKFEEQTLQLREITEKIGKCEEKIIQDEDLLKQIVEQVKNLKERFSEYNEQVTSSFEKYEEAFEGYSEKTKVFTTTVGQIYFNIQNANKAQQDIQKDVEEAQTELTKIERNQYTQAAKSLTQKTNYLIKELIQYGQSKSEAEGITYSKLIEKVKSISSNISETRSSSDVVSYTNSLNELLGEVRQALESISEDTRLENPNSYEDIAQVNKTITTIYNSSSLIQDFVQNVKQNHDGVQIIHDVHSSYNSARQFITATINTYVKDSTKALAQNPTVSRTGEVRLFTPFTKGNKKFVDLNALNIRYINQNPSVFNNAEFMGKYRDYNLKTLAQNRIYNDILQEEEDIVNNKLGLQRGLTSTQLDNLRKIEMQRVFTEDIASGRFAQPLMDSNETLLDVAHSISLSSLRKGSSDKDKETAKMFVKNIQIALKNTYEQIYRLSHFDPDSVLLKQLKKQAEELEKQQEDIEEALKDDSLKGFSDLFKDFTSVTSFFGSALALMGLGGLFSLHTWEDMVKGRANDNGKLMYQNYMLNASMNVPMGLGALDRVYNQGTALYANSYGMIDFGAPTQMYSELVKNVGGAYGASAYSGANDLGRMASAMTLPANLYGINTHTFGEFTDTFYKTNRQDVSTTIGLVNQVIANAQQSNIPIEKYMKLVSDMGKQFRGMGYNGTRAIGNIQYMIDEGMRMEDARDLEGQIIGAQDNWSKNKSNAVYAVMAGQTGNLWSAMLANLKTVDMNGDPIGNRQAMVGQQMMTKLDMLGSWFDNPEMKKFMYMQEFLNQGYNIKNANKLTYAAMSGDPQKLGKLLIGVDEEEEQQTKSLIDSTKKFTNQLKASSNQLSEATKNKANMVVSANKIAESLGSHHSAMNQLTKDINDAVSTFGTMYIEVIKQIGELTNKLKQYLDDHPYMGKMGLWAMQNPVFASILGLGATYGTYKLGTGLWKRALGHWNDYDKPTEQTEKVAEEAKKQNEGKKRTKQIERAQRQLKNMPHANGGTSVLKNFFGKAKGFMKGKAGTIVTIGAGVAMALSGSEAEASEANSGETSEDEAPIALTEMFITGEAKINLKNVAGETITPYNEKGMAKWLRAESDISMATVIGGGVAMASLAPYISSLQSKLDNIKMPTMRNSELPPHTPLETALIETASETPHTTTSEGGGGVGTPMERGSGAKGWKAKTMDFLKNNKWNLALGFGLSMGNEFMGDDGMNRSTSDKIKRGLIDGAVYTLPSMALSRIPYVGPLLAMGLPLASSVVGEATLGYDPLASVSNYLKNLAGVGDNYNVENLKFLSSVVKDGELSGEGFMELIKSETEDGEKFRQFLKDNGLDYEDMKDTEKDIFEEQIKVLMVGQTTIAQILARAMIAFKRAKQINKSGNYAWKKGKHIAEWAKKSFESQAERAFNPDDKHWEEIYLTAEYKIKKYEELLANPDLDEGSKKEFTEHLRQLKIVRAYARYQHNPDDEEVTKFLNSSDEYGASNSTGYYDARGNGIVTNKYTGIEKLKTEGDHWLNDGTVGWFWILKEEMVNRLEALYENDPNIYEDDEPSSPPPSGSSNSAGANGVFPEDAIKQAKLVSQMTGVPVDYILAFFYLESNGLWELSERMHNYGNTVYDNGGGTYNGYGIYATTEEGADALANHTRFFSEDNFRQRALNAANSDNADEFVRVMKDAGYFTDNINHYTQLFHSGLAIARGAGYSGVAEGVAGGLANLASQTIQQFYDAGQKALQSALAPISSSSGKKITGALVNGMYVDPTKQFISIEEEIAKLRKQRDIDNQHSIAQMNEIQNRQQQTEHEKNKQAIRAANDSIAQTSAKSSDRVYNNIVRLQQAIKEVDDAREKRKKEEKDVAHLTIMGKLKKGKTSAQFVQALNELLEKLHFDTETVQVETN